jgi:4-hydroxy-3-methylbut-2-enyl diphosphate reductase
MTAIIGTPLGIERRTVPGAVRVGMGRRTALPDGDAFLIAGVAGGLAASVRPGDVVVAPDASAPLLAGTLRRLGLTVHVGEIHTSDRIVTGASRERLAATGALAVDMETAVLRAAAGDRPFAAVRVVTDTVGAPLWSPGTLRRGVRALSALRTAAPALRQWAAAIGAREVVLAAPRSFRAGAERAVEVAAREGTGAHLVEDAGGIDLAWLAGARTIGITAGASAPPHLGDEVVTALAGLGPVTVRESRAGTENIQFTLPSSVLRR